MDLNHDKVIQSHSLAAGQRTTIASEANFLSGLRTTRAARPMTGRSPSEARSLFPRGLRGRGGERPFSNCESARSAANWRERGSEMNHEDFRRSKCAKSAEPPQICKPTFWA